MVRSFKEAFIQLDRLSAFPLIKKFTAAKLYAMMFAVFLSFINFTKDTNFS